MRTERKQLTISQGNVLQGILVAAGLGFLVVAAQPIHMLLRVAAMLIGYVLIYFCTHAPAHWLIGRLGGIRFSHYSIGGSTHAAKYPPGMRQVFAALPFFAVHAVKDSMKAASSISKAAMFGAGMTSSVLCSTLAALWCLAHGVPGASIVLIVNCVWFVGALIAEAAQGDYSKAARALAS